MRSEFALSVVDVIGRRMRVLFTDLDLAAKFVKPVSSTMAKEFKWTIAKKSRRKRSP